MKSRKQARQVLTVSSFDRIPRWMQQHAYAYFLAPIYCSGAGNQSTVWYISSENKNNLRTILGWNRQKLRTAQPQPKVIGSYRKKERKYFTFK